MARVDARYHFVFFSAFLKNVYNLRCFFFVSNTRERVTRDYNLRLFRVVFEDKFHIAKEEAIYRVSIKSIPSPYISETIQKLWKIVKYDSILATLLKGVGVVSLEEVSRRGLNSKFSNDCFRNVDDEDRLYEHSV